MMYDFLHNMLLFSFDLSSYPYTQMHNLIFYDCCQNSPKKVDETKY